MQLPGTRLELLRAKAEALQALYVVRSRNACEASLATFVREAWGIVEPGTELLWNWHLDTICGYLEAVHTRKVTRLILNVPPGAMKSLLVSVFYPAWTWAKRPTERFLCVTNELDLATRDAVRCKDLLESEWYQARWRLSMNPKQNEKTHYANEKRGHRQSIGLNAMITGKRGSCLAGSSMVATEIGLVRIDALCAWGNRPRVWSFNHETGQVELKPVVAARRLFGNTIGVRTLTGNLLSCTPDHLIWTNRGYTQAKDITGRAVSELQWPDHVQTRQGNTLREVRGYQPGLRNMRERVQAGCRRVRQAFKAWCDGWAVLQQEMLQANAQSCASLYPLCGMRYAVQAAEKKSSLEMVFGGMQAGCSKSKKDASAKAVRSMRNGHGDQQRQAEVLLHVLQEQGALHAHAGEGEFPLQEHHGSGWDIHPNAAAHKGARRSSVRLLPDNEEPWPDEGASVGTSYRQRLPEQCAGESGDSLQRMSHDDPQVINTTAWIDAGSAGTDSCRTVPVYDIQVDENHNFFADGILVHNCILIDDPHDAMRAFSEVDRKNVLNTYDQKLSTRLNHQDKDAIILIMQRLHVDDLTGHLLKKTATNWTHVRIPMAYEGPQFDAGKDLGRPEFNDPRKQDGELMHPALFSADAVRRLNEDLGSYGAAGQLQQRPNPEGGGILKSTWWRIWPADKPLPEFEHIFLSWDTAYTEKDLKDVAYSGYLGFGIFWDEQEQRHAIMLMRAWYARVEYPELRRKAKEITVEIRPDAHLIEKKASGISLVQDMRRIKGVRVRTYQPDRDKIARAYAVSAMLESGQVWAPDRKWADAVISYIAEFPNGSPPSADLTDMCVTPDTLIYCADGVKPISKVHVGDLVLTHKGRFREVTAVMNRRVKAVHDLKAKGLDALRITGNHPAWVFDPADQKEWWVNTEYLKPREKYTFERDGKSVTSVRKQSTSYLMILPEIHAEDEQGKAWLHVSDFSVAKQVPSGLGYWVERNDVVQGDFEVMNLSVFEDESYVTTGGTVHNCTQALIYLRNGYWVSHPDDDDPPPAREAADEDDVMTPIRRGAYG